MLRTLTLSALALSMLAPAAFAVCDISQTKCALKGGKCNIHFKNKTGEATGSAGGTVLAQESGAQIIRVKAVKESGHNAGNALTINAGAQNTLNMDKKANKKFAKIRITSGGRWDVQGVSIGCENVKEILNGSGICKVFHGYGPNEYGVRTQQLGYRCDGGDVVAPTLEKRDE